MAGFLTAHDSNLTPRHTKASRHEFRQGGIGRPFHRARRDAHLEGYVEFTRQLAARGAGLDMHGDLDAIVHGPQPGRHHTIALAMRSRAETGAISSNCTTIRATIGVMSMPPMGGTSFWNGFSTGRASA